MFTKRLYARQASVNLGMTLYEFDSSGEMNRLKPFEMELLQEEEKLQAGI